MDAHGPLRAFRDRYVASYTGLSYDLAPGVIGVHPGRLTHVPELAGKRVAVSHESLATRAPRPTFTVVPLSRLMRNALSLAQTGGVVFSSFDLEDPGASGFLAALREGDSVFLNSAIDRLPEPRVRRPDDRSAS